MNSTTSNDNAFDFAGNAEAFEATCAAHNRNPDRVIARMKRGWSLDKALTTTTLNDRRLAQLEAARSAAAKMILPDGYGAKVTIVVPAFRAGSKDRVEALKAARQISERTFRHAGVDDEPGFASIAPFSSGKRGGLKHFVYAIVAVKCEGTVQQRLADYAAGLQHERLCLGPAVLGFGFGFGVGSESFVSSSSTACLRGLSAMTFLLRA